MDAVQRLARIQRIIDAGSDLVLKHGQPEHADAMYRACTEWNRLLEHVDALRYEDNPATWPSHLMVWLTQYGCASEMMADADRMTTDEYRTWVLAAVRAAIHITLEY